MILQRLMDNCGKKNEHMCLQLDLEPRKIAWVTKRVSGRKKLKFMV
jgi:ribosomal protein L24E